MFGTKEKISMKELLLHTSTRCTAGSGRRLGARPSAGCRCQPALKPPEKKLGIDFKNFI